VFQNSRLWLNPENFIEDDKYLLCDLAYLLSNMSILTYKPPKANASDNTLFNTNLGESRSLEHGIGMLNKKFQTLKKLDVHI
jgi:hypothetical protein